MGRKRRGDKDSFETQRKVEIVNKRETKGAYSADEKFHVQNVGYAASTVCHEGKLCHFRRIDLLWKEWGRK